MRSPYLSQLAQPLAGAAPALRSSRRWPLHADETRLPAAAPPAYASSIPADAGRVRPPALQAVREVFDSPPPSATASRQLTAPGAPRNAQSAASPPHTPRPLPPPGRRQAEPPQTIAADVRLPKAEPVVLSAPQLAAQRPAVAVSTAAPEASVEASPEITGSEVSDWSVPLPRAPAVEPPGAPALPSLRTEATRSTGQSPDAAVSGRRDRVPDDAGWTSLLSSRRSLNEPNGQSAAAAAPSLKIGTVEVRVVTPPLAAPPQQRTANASGTLSRGFVSPFGLRQG